MFFLLVFCPDVTGMVDWALARTAGLLWLIRFCHLILVIILAISVVSLFKLDNDTGDLVSVGWEKNDSMFCCAILMQLDVEWKQSRENHSVQMLYSNRNGMVRYLAVSTHTLGPVDSRRGEGGVASSMWRVRHLVWLSVHCLTCWLTLDAILFSWNFHLLPDLGSRAWY